MNDSKVPDWAQLEEPVEEVEDDRRRTSEIEGREREALAVVSTREPRGLVEVLAHLEHGEQIIERWSRMMETLQRNAIAATLPEHWVLMKGKDDPDSAAVAIPKAMACATISNIYGIDLRGVGPVAQNGDFAPVREVADGKVRLRAYCESAVSKTTSRHTDRFESEIRSDEEFIGRKGNDGDLRSALLTRLRSKAARILSGTSGVSVQVLAEAWAGTSKSLDRCVRGAGWGKGGARQAEKEQAPDVQTAARQLGRLLSQVVRWSGVEEKAEVQTVATDLLQHIKKVPDKGLKGIRNLSSFGHLWQIDQAKRRLLEDRQWGEVAREVIDHERTVAAEGPSDEPTLADNAADRRPQKIGKDRLRKNPAEEAFEPAPPSRFGFDE